MNLEETPVVAVGVDGSQSSKTALAWAKSFAGRHGAGLRAIMTWRYPSTAVPGEMFSGPALADLHDVTAQTLDATVDEIVGVDHGERVVRQGSPAMSLLEAGDDAALLVVGRRGRGGFAGTGLGSTSRQCAIHTERPLAIVGDLAPPLPIDPKIVVPVDGSDHSINALVWALAELPGEGPIVAVYSHDEWILDDVPDDAELACQLHAKAERRLVAVAESAGIRTGVRTSTLTLRELCVAGAPLAEAVGGTTGSPHSVELRVVRGDPRTTVWDIVAEERADVVVVGARGRTGLAGAILGSFTTHAAHHCPEDVTLVVVP